MMSDNVAIWRQAIQDNTHSLHSITWSLFSSSFKAEKIAQTYANQQETLLPYLKQIMATEKLYEKGSLGNGLAPANAARLCFFWQGIDILSDLLHASTSTSF